MNLFKNYKTIYENGSKIREIRRGKKTKLNNLIAYLLGGRPVTGATMVAKFNIYSYRDAIYRLREKGYEIKSKTIVAKNGIHHELWYLSCFDEDFILMREEKIF